MALTPEQWSAIANAIGALAQSIPGIIAAIQASNAPNKEELIAKIRAAQASWPEWV